MGAEWERGSVSHLWRRERLANGKGLVQEKQRGHLAPHGHMLCLMCSFTPQPAECNWEISSKELLLLVLPLQFVHLHLLISCLALRSCRAGQWAAQTDGGLAPALIQWTDSMHLLAERSLDLMYFLRLHVCQSCSHLWIHLRDLTDETPSSPAPPQAATQLSQLLTKCFVVTSRNTNTTKCCECET